jgi:hypothetical protein
MRLKAIVAVCAMLALTAIVARPAHAQSISTADLAGTWSVFQLATPAGGFAGSDVRSYSSFNGSSSDPLTFDGTGTVTGGTLTDDLGNTFPVTGQLSVTAAGIVTGTLTLGGGGGGPLVVREARMLFSKHTIVGASTILGNPGLFTLVRLESGQTFSLNGDVANDGDGTGNYTYHEITPSNQGAGTPNDASWTTGSIKFHENLVVTTFGCTEADLVLADGTIRAQQTGIPTSFG